jgi:hypothetical protein
LFFGKLIWGDISTTEDVYSTFDYWVKLDLLASQLWIVVDECDENIGLVGEHWEAFCLLVAPMIEALRGLSEMDGLDEDCHEWIGECLDMLAG